jgi:hypothetical protein
VGLLDSATNCVDASPRQVSEWTGLSPPAALAGSHRRSSAQTQRLQTVLFLPIAGLLDVLLWATEITIAFL